MIPHDFFQLSQTFSKTKKISSFCLKSHSKEAVPCRKKCDMFYNNMLQKEQESDVSLFITHVQACVAIIRLLEIAWILTSDCITLRGNQTISGSYVTRCKRSSSWVGKTRNTYRLYCKKELLNTHYSLLSRYKAQHRHCTRFAAFNVEKQAARFTVPYLCRSDKDESPC